MRILAKLNKRYFIVGAALLLVVLYTTGTIPHKNNGDGMKTEPVTYRDITVSVSASGSVESDRDTKAYFGTMGKISELRVNEGDKVEKGDVLATLDSVSLYNTYLAAQNELRVALASLDIAVEARKEWLETNNDKEFDDVVRAQRAQKDAGVRSASAKADAIKANVAVAGDALSKGTLVSPIEGTILEINNIESGLNITTTTNSYIRVAITEKTRFVASIDEVDLNDVQVGQDVDIELDAFKGEVFKGKVTYVYDFAERLSSGSKIVSVEVEFNEPNEKIKLGLGGDADFVSERKDHVLSIPKKALKVDGTKSYVKIMDKSGNIISKDVKVGLINTKYVEIMEGLLEGDSVVISENSK